MEMDPPPKMLASLTMTILMMMMATSIALASDAVVLEGQARALLVWKDSLDNQSKQALHSWGNTSTPCNWRGVSCDTGVQRHQHLPVISGISLRGMRLRGALESLNFSALRTLTRLDLSHNLLAGSIPPSIEVLGELHALLLQGNQIRGSIPLGLGNLTKLHSLILHENELYGEIPSQIGNMSSLVTLNLSSNHLVGHIPCEIGHIKHLVALDLSNNNLFGKIPSSIGGLTELTSLYLYEQTFWTNSTRTRLSSELKGPTTWHQHPLRFHSTKFS